MVQNAEYYSQIAMRNDMVTPELSVMSDTGKSATNTKKDATRNLVEWTKSKAPSFLVVL